MTDARPTFTVHLQAKPDSPDDEVMRMLRAALKMLGRRYGFRAVRIEQAKSKEAETWTPNT